MGNDWGCPKPPLFFPHGTHQRGLEPRPRGSARAGQTTEPSAGRKPAARAKRQDINVSNHRRRMIRGGRGTGAGAGAASDPAPAALVGTHEKRPQRLC